MPRTSRWCCLPKPARYPTVKRGWVIWHLIEHELQHGTEIALILRQNGLPTFEL